MVRQSVSIIYAYFCNPVLMFQSVDFAYSFISGITLLGTPTEIYVYGIQYVYIVGGVIAMGITMGSAYLPVFHDLQLTSTYEVNLALKYFAVRVIKNFQASDSELRAIILHWWALLSISNIRINNKQHI